MKLYRFLLLLLLPLLSQAQHQSKVNATLSAEADNISVFQEITYHNTSNDYLEKIVLNDWNNAFSSKNSALAKRFSDEFVRSFYYASDKELGKTTIYSIRDRSDLPIAFHRPEKHIDLVEIELKYPLAPGAKISFNIQYEIKIPSDKFTHFGFDNNGKIELKDWLLFPARYENGDFLRYSNENLDDNPNALTDFEITLNGFDYRIITSNLKVQKPAVGLYSLSGKNLNLVHLVVERKSDFRSFKTTVVEVETNLFDENIDEIWTALTIEKIINFVNDHYPNPNQKKIVVSEADYKRNPFYGLNQLPSFLRPFPDSFLYELKFLKTYTESFLRANLNIDRRKDNWIFDALQMQLILSYLEEHHPDMKMVGGLAKLNILKGYYGTKMNFEDQFYYLYLMMARRNLDQPVGLEKDKLIKFNEQISGKYRAGLNLKHLDSYLGDDALENALKDFFALNQTRATSEADFKALLSIHTNKDINWFFEESVHSRNLIDYKISKIKKNKDSVQITLKNKGEATVPISVFGLKKGEVVFQRWVDHIEIDSTISVFRNGADKVVVNYDGAVPEYNRRNNSKSLKGALYPNRPLKLTFFKDFEDPHTNQLFFMPDFRYNYYDGFAPGFRFSNKSMLRKPFVFDVSPLYSFNTQSIVGSYYVGFENQIREGNLYAVNYGIQGNRYHYAPDAEYMRIIPSVLFRIREPNFRDNKQQQIYARYVMVDREKSAFNMELKDENYSVFNLRYTNIQSEITNHFKFSSDVQLSSLFGKLSSQVDFRRLYNNNRQLNLRFFGGLFMYRSTTSDFFSFATDRPTDYLFDYNYYGRSESEGFFAQQLIMAEGGFKSKLTPYANQWILATNASFNVWNWIEVYGDLGFIKNQYQSPEFLYDSGIRLNLVTDYFEVYFPMYSNLGWEVGQPNYAERIRFVLTIAPNTLINLFTRKWF